MGLQTCMLGIANQAVTATLGTGNAEAALPIGNLAVSQCSPSYAWQTTAGTLIAPRGAWFTADTGNPNTLWRLICLPRTNLTTAATIRIRIGSREQVLRGEALLGQGGGGLLLESGAPIAAENAIPSGSVPIAPTDYVLRQADGTPYLLGPGLGAMLLAPPTPSGAAYDTGWQLAGVVPGLNQVVIVLPAAVQGAVCRVDLDDAPNPDGFISVGGAFLGDAVQLRFNVSSDSGDGRDDTTDVQVTRGGQEYVTPRVQQRVADLVWPAILASEMALMRQLDQLCRLDRNILVVPSPGAASGAAAELIAPIFGRLKPSSRFKFLGPSGGYRSWAATITERL